MQGGSGSGKGPGTTAQHSPGPAFVPPRPEDLAPFFPQLEILELLGQGGMGVVYKARQVRLDRLVALKILPPELGRDPAFAERFAREARALARLTHPRIVGVHDFGEAGGLFYLVMEFVDGVNLRGLLRRGRSRPEEALRVVPQICEALQYAHEEGVVHRDIKPENILLDRRGNVKIADFGLAKLLGMMTPDSVLTGSRQVIGTLRYMAPEQMESPLKVDHRADIYSLGVVFYEMLTGELPLGRFDPPSKKVEVDIRLDEVVLRALEKEPERRYQQASEVKIEVEALSDPSGHPSARPGISRHGDPSRPPSSVGRWPAWRLPALIGAIYALSFLFPAYKVSGRPSALSIEPPPILSGYSCFINALKAGQPYWLANPLLWLGCLALLIRRSLWAGVIGLIAVPLALSVCFVGDVPVYLVDTFLAGYWMWVASMVLLAGGGLYGWWRSRRQGPAGHTKAALSEMDPP
jgi:serine/threonine protein kinase